ARGATRATFLVIVLTGLAAGALLGLFLSRTLIGPIARLQRAAGEWRLGKAWEMPPEPGSPEVLDLQRSVQEMSRRLNDQYEALAKLERLKTRLVAMVSHEFNNSLGIMMSVLALLKGQGGEDVRKEKKDEYHEILSSQVRSMALASANLLNMAQVEEGKLKVLKRRVELGALLLEGVERMEVLAQLKEIGLRTEFPAGPLWVLAAPDALSLIVNNLVSNAIKYTPPRGRVEVGFGAESAGPGNVRMWVRDTGIGIAAGDKERIFSGFFRTEEGKKAAKGFGIGLTLVKSLVEAHGVELALQSEPGRGSTFSFTLPVQADPGPGKQAA
ncbi:MAG: HAMP domain-containing sensor histidine kinase, partial [Elusimicrobiota bacterium]